MHVRARACVSACVCACVRAECMGTVIVNLQHFARLCPVNSPQLPSIVGLKYGSLVRGQMPAKKGSKGSEQVSL